MDWTTARNHMVDRQIAARGIRDPLLLEAMRTVPRERFVPATVRSLACQDGPLPIGAEQTISQPYVVACMIESLALQPGQHVLDVGTGSGYTAAILSAMGMQVYTVERVSLLLRRAERNLADSGFTGIAMRLGDGSQGWSEYAPFEGIIVSASAPDLPPSLQQQMAPGARMVLPAGSQSDQHLWLVTRHSATRWTRKDMGSVRFVPLIGSEGWNGSDR